MIRVLHVVGCLELGGTEAYIMNIYRNIDRTKIQFDFLVLNKKEYIYADEIRNLGGNIYFSEFPQYKHLLRAIKSYKSIMQKYNFHAVHSHINIMNSWVLLAAKLAGVKIRISHSHDTYGKGGNFVYRLIHNIEAIIIKKCATILLACSTAAGNYLYGDMHFFKNGKVINNAIDVEKYIHKDENKVNILCKDFNVNKNKQLVVGNITRFEEKKNQLFLIDVFNSIVSEAPNAVLLLGGIDGGLMNDCIEKVKRLNLEDRVHFIGARNDVQDVLHLIDIYLFPSLYEGLGIVLLEAQAAGCYCVASAACPDVSDMGLNLIDYISLDDSADIWADRTLRGYYNAKKINISYTDIVKAFDNKRYSLNYLVKEMTRIYLEGVI